MPSIHNPQTEIQQLDYQALDSSTKYYPGRRICSINYSNNKQDTSVNFLIKYWANFYLIPLIILTTLVVVILFWPMETNNRLRHSYRKEGIQTAAKCNIQLVETIPEGMKYTDNGSSNFLSTYDAWQILFNNAKSTLNIASYSWSLRAVDVYSDNSDAQGREIFERILANSFAKQKLRIRIIQSSNKEVMGDTQIFTKSGAAELITLDVEKYMGKGLMHTKLFVVDKRHFYVGSANMDWRSLAQVKELGVLAQNCSELAKDVGKIFDLYWHIGSHNKTALPKFWPLQYHTHINVKNPLIVTYNENYTMGTYFSSSPPLLSSTDRTNDLDAVLNAIDSANRFVYAAVMDYLPLIIYTTKPCYWPHIDNALRRAAIERKVEIRLLISLWQHSDASANHFLHSLQILSDALQDVNIKIRRFVLPSDAKQLNISFARVNNNKFLVTDNIAYIGTSDWFGDYFTYTTGVGLTFKDATLSKNTLRTELLQIFERDWYSSYAMPLKYV